MLASAAGQPAFWREHASHLALGAAWIVAYLVLYVRQRRRGSGRHRSPALTGHRPVTAAVALCYATLLGSALIDRTLGGVRTDAFAAVIAVPPLAFAGFLLFRRRSGLLWLVTLGVALPAALRFTLVAVDLASAPTRSSASTTSIDWADALFCHASSTPSAALVAQQVAALGGSPIVHPVSHPPSVSALLLLGQVLLAVVVAVVARVIDSCDLPHSRRAAGTPVVVAATPTV